MTAVPSIDPAHFLNEQLSQASPDLMRDLLTTFVNALLSAQADAVCGAGYGERTPERVNSRNGYRHRDLDTRVGTLDVAVPKLRTGSLYPDWLLELRSKTDGKFVPAVVESKSGAEMADARSDSTHPTFAKAKRLAELAEETGIRAGIVYKDSAGAWNVTTGEKYGILTSTPAKEYFTL